MMQLKPLSGISRSIKEAEEYRETRDMLKSFAKYLPTAVRLSKWIELDKEMGGKPITEMPFIFQRVNLLDFPWVMGICPKPVIKPWELIAPGSIKDQPIWREFGRVLRHPENPQHKALVLFRLNRLGIWVMHNMDPPNAGAYVCIPAQQVGNSNIIIESLAMWAERNYHD